MVLQSVQLLLVAVSSLEERFVALSNSLEFTRQSLQLIVIVQICAFAASHITVELSRATALRLLLAHELALSFEQE